MATPDCDWYKTRQYIHFDLPVSKKKATQYVISPESVSKHAFYPMIKYELITEKIRFNKKNKKIEKLDPKKREICYSSHMDSHIYSYYCKLLEKKYENKIKTSIINKSILAFRRFKDPKCNIHFALNAFNYIKEKGECCAIALDVSGFFSSLDPDILKRKWCELLDVEKMPQDHFNIYKSLIRQDSVDKVQLYKELGIALNKHKKKACPLCFTKPIRCKSCKPKKIRRRICEPNVFRSIVRKNGMISSSNKENIGIPQGTPISAMLSNIYMFDFDVEMKLAVNQVNGTYFRYCDDMLFIVPICHKKNMENLAKESIRKLKLEINDKKTEVRTFNNTHGIIKSDKPLQYLGFIFDGENIFIRSSSLARYSDRMRRGVSLAYQTMRKYNKVKAAHAIEGRGVFKRKLYSRYTHLGQRNFITYGYCSAKTMDSKSINKQLKPLFSRFNKTIERYNV
jgi:hypothetical protein